MQNSSQAQVPLITLAPESGRFSRRKIVTFIGYAAGLFGVVAVALGVIFLSVWTQNNAISQNAFNEADIRTDVHDRCLALVRDVRSNSLDEIMGDVVNSSGVAKDYNFAEEYEKAFDEILGEDYTEMERTFADCCFMVSYTEYWAKLYKHDSEKFLIGGLYKDKAEKYRRYADQLWDMLCKAETMSDLQAIIDFCANNKIIEVNRE